MPTLWRSALIAVAMLAGGCAGLQPAQVESPNLHVLEVRPLAPVVPAPLDVVIEVSVPHAWPGFESAQMIYVQRPFELDHYANNQWADSPARMLGPLLAQALEQSGGFRAVVQAGSGIAVDMRVNTDLVRLQQVFVTKPSRVELALRVQLVDVRARRVLATRVFEETETAPADDPYGGVIAANVALQRALERIAAFCVAETAGARAVAPSR